MSTLATIKVDLEHFGAAVESDAKKFWTAFQKVWKGSPTALQQIDNFINEVGPVVVTAIDLADPAMATPANAALAEVQTAVAALKASADAANSGTSVEQNLANLNDTAATTLTALQVSDPLKSKIEAVSNLITSECKVLIPAVQAWVAEIQKSKGTTPSA